MTAAHDNGHACAKNMRQFLVAAQAFQYALPVRGNLEASNKG
jgi:hypothetical protein